MAEQSPISAPQVSETELAPTPLANGTVASADVDMADSTPLKEPTPQPQTQAPPQTATTPTPAPAAMSTPTRNSPHPSAPAQQAPTQPIPHGSPTRVYLNQHVTPHLLEAMKHLATTEPEKPLKWLSEFLAMKSAEIEG